MKEFQILLDVWEGSLDIDEDVLLAEGVAGVIPRLNDINGGHHMDTNFTAQYQQAKPFPVHGVIYFVYNPWVSGRANFEWLAKHAPADVRSVMPDIEVTYPGYEIPSGVYSNEVQIFFDLCKQNWTSFIYTGGWFYNRLKYWPDADYCIARYPYSLYPSTKERWTWDQLRGALLSMKYYPGLPPNMKTGVLSADRLKLWQCSGDRLILPGTKDRPVDVIVYPGSLESLVSWLGGTVPEPKPVELTLEEKVNLLWEGHPTLH
ncbi:MAG: hypothetical protein AAGU05_12845, partial [Anaerolineaceae bacterium]